MSTAILTPSEYLDRWLLGATCRRPAVKRTIEWTDGPFILLRHHGHTEYVGGFTNTTWCETFFELHDRRLNRPEYGSRTVLKKWTGRWSKAKQQEMELMVEHAERQR